MRIDAYTQMQVQQLNSTKKAAKPQTSAKASFSDQLQLSSFGKDLQTARAAVNSSKDIRTNLVADIKERIQNGTYSVDTADFADKLFAKYEESR